MLNHKGVDGVAWCNMQIVWHDCWHSAPETVKKTLMLILQLSLYLWHAKMRSRKNWVNDVALTKLQSKTTTIAWFTQSVSLAWQLHHAWVETSFYYEPVCVVERDKSCGGCKRIKFKMPEFLAPPSTIWCLKPVPLLPSKQREFQVYPTPRFLACYDIQV